ncbi:MalY/PatB family protein [Microbacterium nymphoidis]|uniref:MalY/PatB family protein n=1 Tax=Microbacterium nymphoidis TaxID=2898586 RepID=UPI001E30CA92|nr:aminotransferase class I/II-fold pyridoxal phosphate-dependent enzyme [Microbacterium nymphoidis]MCD2497305.1 aminotransferase class I/II-fold pyridoxal phosphate-dependent enzyme [Microbacterium nymphoidis]
MTDPIDALPIETLRRRGSTKWAKYPADVLPLFVAESDFPLAPAITEALAQAVALGDTGYTPPAHPLQAAFADFSARRHDWEVDPARVRTTADVVMGLVEIMRGVISPGDGVIITPPVYPPFYDAVPEAGGEVVRVPLLSGPDGWSLDLAGIDAAFAAGARAMLLCNPHNPTGTVHDRDTLVELARIARTRGAVVISDEIHAPLVREGVAFTPFLSASEDAREVGFTVTSASKAYNLAGLKCALMVTASDRTTRVVDELPVEVEWRTGWFGVIAGVAAYAPESDAWLDAVRARLDLNRELVGSLVEQHLPGARYLVPDAGYLAWIDVRPLGWADDAAEWILENARVAVNPGPTFGDEGRGFIRVNFATSPEILQDAFARLGSLA